MKHDITRMKQQIEELALEAHRHGWELMRVDMRKATAVQVGETYESQVVINIDDPEGT